MKKIFWLVSMCASLCMATSCNGNGNGNEAGTSNAFAGTESSNSANSVNVIKAPDTNEPNITYQFDGSIDTDNWTPGQKCTITFDGFPRTLAGLKKAQEEIGKRPEGAVLLQLFAFEIYGHNRTKNKAAGEECIKLVNVENNVNSVLRIIQDKYNPKFADTYMPHLVASYLKGATALNAYKADKPFSITIQSAISTPQDVEAAKGTDIFLQVLCHGVDNNANGGSWRGCEVMKQKGSPYYKVYNSPSLYVGVQPVSFKTDDEYTDICNQ